MIGKGRYINELKNSDYIKAVFLVSERKILMAKSGKNYCKFLLSDKTGSLSAFLWDDAQEQIKGIEVGDVIGVKGNVESYEGRLQIRIEQLKKLSESEVDIAWLQPTTNKDIEAMKAELMKAVDSIRDPYISRLVKGIVSRPEIREGLFSAPAAKSVHHNYRGGLLEHTVNLVKLVDAALGIYAEFSMNRDLIMAGAILHDIGKIDEYVVNKIIDITPKGRLIGHVYISSKIVDEEISLIENFPDELRLHIIHLILSHHGELEFGSPKVPMTLEAMFLHTIDDMDAKIAGFASIIRSTPETEPFSPFSGVYNRHLYTRRYGDDENGGD